MAKRLGNVLSLSPLLLAALLDASAAFSPRTPRDFFSDRDEILAAEDSTFLGADLQLNSEEASANDYLMSIKNGELDQAFEDSFYPPSHSFFQTKEDIEDSEVFSFLRAMPKGAALHVHDLSIASVDWVVSNLTYRPDLYICEDDSNVPRFTWAASAVDAGSDCSSGWASVADRRAESGAGSFDDFLKESMVITVDDPAQEYPDINTVWATFEVKLGVLNGILFYEPAIRDYFRQALLEFLQDNVQLIEIRTVLPEGVCTGLNPDCAPLTQLELAGAFKEVADAFTDDFSSVTCGVRMIYAPVRRVTPETVADYLQTATELRDTYPDFFVGFDLVGQEDLGNPLVDFADELVGADPDLAFYFHAGETDWQGQATDLNIMDALLLGTKRIGHGYAIAKHPESKRMAIEAGVPIEVCPISNQVLGLVTDLRNHPAAALIQEGFPLVISSDDPGTWEAVGLSHDYYMAFMGLASRTMDLRLLKQLAFSSVQYSSLADSDKDECEALLQSQWDIFVQTVAKKGSQGTRQLKTKEGGADDGTPATSNETKGGDLKPVIQIV